MSNTPAKSIGRKSVQVSAKPQELMTDKPQLAHAWSAQVITLFPDAFPGLLGESLTGKALKDGSGTLASQVAAAYIGHRLRRRMRRGRLLLPSGAPELPSAFDTAPVLVGSRMLGSAMDGTAPLC